MYIHTLFVLKLPETIGVSYEAQTKRADDGMNGARGGGVTGWVAVKHGVLTITLQG